MNLHLALIRGILEEKKIFRWCKSVHHHCCCCTAAEALVHKAPKILWLQKQWPDMHFGISNTLNSQIRTAPPEKQELQPVLQIALLSSSCATPVNPQAKSAYRPLCKETFSRVAWTASIETFDLQTNKLISLSFWENFLPENFCLHISNWQN